MDPVITEGKDRINGTEQRFIGWIDILLIDVGKRYCIQCYQSKGVHIHLFSIMNEHSPCSDVKLDSRKYISE